MLHSSIQKHKMLKTWEVKFANCFLVIEYLQILNFEIYNFEIRNLHFLDLEIPGIL